MVINALIRSIFNIDKMRKVNKNIRFFFNEDNIIIEN